MNLPIEPGSDVDQALDAVVAHELGERPMPDPDLLDLINPCLNAHMLALGTRMYFRLAGIRDATQLVEPQYEAWYGQGAS